MHRWVSSWAVVPIATTALALLYIGGPSFLVLGYPLAIVAIVQAGLQWERAPIPAGLAIFFGVLALLVPFAQVFLLAD
jgi:hypothetical protein